MTNPTQWTARPSLVAGAGRRRATIWLAAALAVALGTAVSVLTVSPAKAAAARMTIGTGKASCPQGYVCLWTLSNYTGQGYAFFNTEDSYAVLPSPFNGINNNSYSFYNRGDAGSVEDVRLYRGDNRTGDNFVLCRGDSIPELPPNSDVDPPDTNWPGRGWRDQVSGHTWGSYC